MASWNNAGGDAKWWMELLAWCSIENEQAPFIHTHLHTYTPTHTHTHAPPRTMHTHIYILTRMHPGGEGRPRVVLPPDRDDGDLRYGVCARVCVCVCDVRLYVGGWVGACVGGCMCMFWMFSSIGVHAI